MTKKNLKEMRRLEDNPGGKNDHPGGLRTMRLYKRPENNYPNLSSRVRPCPSPSISFCSIVFIHPRTLCRFRNEKGNVASEMRDRSLEKEIRRSLA